MIIFLGSQNGSIADFRPGNDMDLYYLNGSLLQFSSIVAIIILVGGFMEKGLKDECTRICNRLLVLNIVYNTMNSIGNFLLYYGRQKSDFLYVFSDVVNTLAYFGILLQFADFMVVYVSPYMEVPKKWIRIAHGHVIIAEILYFVYLAEKDGLVDLNSGNILYIISTGAGYIYAGYIFWFMRRCGKYMNRQEAIILTSFGVLPTVAAIITIVLPGTVFVPLGITLSMLLINNYIHMKQAERLQEKEKELVEKQIQVMVSQIQPHFLFNVLNTIYILCESDPKKAQEAINYFSMYLRTNLDSLSGREVMIPIRTELDHVDHYLMLEKMRYGDDLQVERDIESDSFWIPSLTVQPIVENSVKHGIHSRMNGGTISISTRELMDCYEVCVRDDGKGFDPDEVQNDGKLHVGLKNVRERLAKACKGELVVDSTVGVGTVVRIRIPKEEMRQDG